MYLRVVVITNGSSQTWDLLAEKAPIAWSTEECREWLRKMDALIRCARRGERRVRGVVFCDRPGRGRVSGADHGGHVFIVEQGGDIAYTDPPIEIGVPVGSIVARHVALEAMD